MRPFILLLSAVFLFAACNKGDENPDSLSNVGSGDYTYTGYAPLADKPIKCFYHIPENSTTTTPVMVVVHGAGRDAQSLRDGLISTANSRGFIVLAPQFSEQYYPGNNPFTLANVFQDGENPTPQSINPEEVWTFQVFDPLFQDFKTQMGSTVAQYDIFGHSAGAQLVHRYLQFLPEGNYNRLVSSAAGWYMMPDETINFPYGLKVSPAAQVNSANYFGRYVLVMVGALDTDPNSFNLRHTPEADAQGFQRVERAEYFFQQSGIIAEGKNQTFNWQYHAVPNVGHNADAMAINAAKILYP